jgi:hypothetical protein
VARQGAAAGAAVMQLAIQSPAIVAAMNFTER